MTIPSAYKLTIFQNVDALQQATVELIISSASKSIATNGRFVIALSGGQTPQKIYSLLAKPVFHKRMDWNRVFIFWGDERCVPLDDAQNNAHQAITLLLSKVSIPPGNIHRIKVNLSPTSSAMEYQLQLDEFFGIDPPRFDLVLLGLGENGHTASLFPGSKVIEESLAGVKAVFVEEENRFRVTMTAPLINRARHIVFLVTGNNKADILNRVLTGPYQPARYPAQLIRPADGTVDWYVDEAAAAFIKR